MIEEEEQDERDYYLQYVILGILFLHNKYGFNQFFHLTLLLNSISFFTESSGTRPCLSGGTSSK